MQQETALYILRQLAKLDLIWERSGTFVVEGTPRPIHFSDIQSAFKALSDVVDKRTDRRHPSTLFDVTQSRIIVYCGNGVFNKLYEIIFTKQNLVSNSRTDTSTEEGRRDRELPTLFVSPDKTQVRQIPLMEDEPFDYRFLLELGGMIIVKTDDIMKITGQVQQFLNNYPQYDTRVELKRCPDETFAFFTYWFQRRKI